MRLTSERLPWLEDEPVAARPSAAARATSSKGNAGRGMWPWYLLLALLVVAVGVGAWWLGTAQRDAAAPELPAEGPVSVPVNRAPAPTSPAPALSENTPLTAPVVAPPPAPTPAARRPVREGPAPRATRGSIEVDSGIASEAGEATGRSTFPADDPVIAAPPATGPAPVVIYNPNPNRGRVVQLGAFPTRAQAEETWRRVTRRYPYLATKPKMVNTVDVRSLGGGRRTRMFRLQLGTSSQAQSAVICQQLEKAGQSCVVVY
ncbi:hypothetical protein GCM10022281_13720 [Sphingomonas rosea]|uniref:SPOR domain-containing protein n=1 Tax=Sphingomonas rosea TaxID=335605 RepID=A0ABP7U2E9_9SPHN